MKVIFDTNALLMPFEFGVNPYKGVRDIVAGAELVTLEDCVQELKGLKPLKWKSILSLGLQNGLKTVKSGVKGLSVDDTIVEYAKKNECLVLTQDKILKKKLLNNGLRVVIMRQKKYFKITG